MRKVACMARKLLHPGEGVSKLFPSEYWSSWGWLGLRDLLARWHHECFPRQSLVHVVSAIGRDRRKQWRKEFVPSLQTTSKEEKTIRNFCLYYCLLRSREPWVPSSSYPCTLPGRLSSMLERYKAELHSKIKACIAIDIGIFLEIQSNNIARSLPLSLPNWEPWIVLGR